MKRKFEIMLAVGILVLSIFYTIPISAGASSAVSYSPGIYSSGGTVLADALGGDFGQGSTVYFYVSSQSSSSGIIGSYIGSYALPAGSTTLYYAHVEFTFPDLTPGTYYILASNSPSPSSASAQFSSAFGITVSSLKPTLTISGSQPMNPATLTGSGWDPGATVSLFLAGVDGTPLFSSVVGNFTATSSGSVPLGSEFTVPSVSMGSYTIVAEEVSSSSPNDGITSDSPMSVTPFMSVSPYDTSGTLGSSFNIYGYGFPAGVNLISNSLKVGGISESNSPATASQSGSFTVSAQIITKLTTTGPQTVSIEYNSSTYSQSNAIFVSTPGVTGPSLSLTVLSRYVYPNSPFKAVAYDFPASSNVQLYLGNQSIGEITTDANGFGIYEGYLPYAPAGSYNAVAYSNGIIVSVPLTLQSYFTATDPSGSQMISSSEYFPSGGTYRVSAYGLQPGTEYSFADSAASIQMGSGIVNIIDGSFVTGSQFKFVPLYNGTLIFTFRSFFASGSSTSSIIVSGISGMAGQTYGYIPYSSPVFSLSSGTVSIMEQSSSQTLTVSNIIPYGSLVYPGLGYSYELYLGNNILSFTTGGSRQQTSILTSSRTSSTITFTVPNISSGIYELSIHYAGDSSPISYVNVDVSTPSLSLDSGSIVAIPIQSGGHSTGYYISGFGFYQSASVKLYYYTEQGANSVSLGLTDGAFTYGGLSAMPNEPMGVYAIYAVASFGTGSYITNSSYTVFPYMDLSSSSGGIGSSIAFTLTGFTPNTYYTIDVGSRISGYAFTNIEGYSTGTLTVPLMQPGTYKVAVYSSYPVYSANFTVTPSQTLITNVNGFAFPGELVNYTWKSSYLPNPSGPSRTDFFGPVWLTVYLNGSAFSTVSAQTSNGAIYGSFQMPNGNPGSYSLITLSWTQNVYETTVNSSSSTEYTLVSVDSHSMSAGNGVFMELVSGNGALITGIGPDQIAEITASVNGSITSSLRIPLSELNASVTSINNDMVTISTKFGNMESTLSAINASILSINNGIAIIKTSLGEVQSSLSSINATVYSVNEGLIALKTSIGNINTTLNSLSPEIYSMNSTEIKLLTVAGMINYNVTQFGEMELKSIDGTNATIMSMIGGMNVSLEASLSTLDTKVTSIGGNEVKIQTILGTMNGNITGISNGIATIQTSLGIMQTNISSIRGHVNTEQTGLNMTTLILVLIAALVVVTLVMGIVAVAGVRQMKRLFEMKKE